MVLVGAEGCTHTPVHSREPRGCLRLSGGDPVGFHPGTAECDPTLSRSRRPRACTRSAAQKPKTRPMPFSSANTLTRTCTSSKPPRAPSSPTQTHFWGRVDSQPFFCVSFFFFFTPFHPGSISCLARACCSHVTLTDSRMNDLFGVRGGGSSGGVEGRLLFFNCQRWMASIGVLSLLMNQAICHFKQIHPRVVVQARCSERTPGTATVCLEGGGETGEKGWGGEIVKQPEKGSILRYKTQSPTLLPLSLFDIFMQI